MDKRIDRDQTKLTNGETKQTGRTEQTGTGRMGGRADGRTGGETNQTDGKTKRPKRAKRTDGRTDGQTDGRTDGRTERTERQAERTEVEAGSGGRERRPGADQPKRRYGISGRLFRYVRRH